MSHVRPYELTDYPTIVEWAEQYGIEQRETGLPKTGFIVPGVAAGFIYSTDSDCCWIENVIANKDATKDEKDEALDLLVPALLQKAEEMGFRVAYATTNNVNLILKVKEYGGLVRPLQMLLTKILSPSL